MQCRIAEELISTLEISQHIKSKVSNSGSTKICICSPAYRQLGMVLNSKSDDILAALTLHALTAPICDNHAELSSQTMDHLYFLRLEGTGLPATLSHSKKYYFLLLQNEKKQ